MTASRHAALVLHCFCAIIVVAFAPGHAAGAAGRGTAADRRAQGPHGRSRRRRLQPRRDEGRHRLQRPLRPRFGIAKTGTVLATLGGHTEGVRSASFSPDGTRVVTAARDGSAKIWDAGTRGTDQERCRGTASMLEYAAFSSDGNHIVTASRDEKATVWDAKTGEAVADLVGHKSPVMRAAFSADGKRVITASTDKTARIWEQHGRQVDRHAIGPHRMVLGAAFSPDGKLAATAASDKSARLWNAETGALIAPLAGHTRAVTQIYFSPDGARILTASQDKTARIWDAKTGALLVTLTGHNRAGRQRASSAPTASASSPPRTTRPRACGTRRPARCSPHCRPTAARRRRSPSVATARTSWLLAMTAWRVSGISPPISRAERSGRACRRSGNSTRRTPRRSTAIAAAQLMERGYLDDVLARLDPQNAAYARPRLRRRRADSPLPDRCRLPRDRRRCVRRR